MKSAIAILVLLLSACGGGQATQADIDEAASAVTAANATDGHKTFGPPDCVNHPEICI